MFTNKSIYIYKYPIRKDLDYKNLNIFYSKKERKENHKYLTFCKVYLM